MNSSIKAIVRSVTPPIVLDVLRKTRGRPARSGEFDLELPKRLVKQVLERNNLAYLDGKNWWFYSSYLYQHNSTDVLAAALLRYLRDNVRRDALVFESGCGCGWFLIGLAQLGFTNLSGSDILGNAIKAAQEFAAYRGYRMELWQDNGFAPKRVPDNIDVFIATQWLYSAWVGNYSDENKELQQKGAQQLLREFFTTYAGHIAPNGLFIFMLVDSIANLCPDDTGTYPVRHSYEDVKQLLDEFGFVLEKRFFGRGDHQPRMAYIARKK
jgi:SAM-dependent methyltransferase